MAWLGFITFWAITLVYIWNGKDNFNKREWLHFMLKLFRIFIVTAAFSLVLKSILTVWPVISLPTAKYVTLILSTSLLAVWAMKFLVVMLCTMFSRMLDFHQQHNTAENYAKLSSLSNNFGPALLILAKCFVSAGSILIFYGIWLGTTY
ncbi:MULTISPECIES: hypothetical protein [unclassified Brenneria]|uniref:hypothetical protein n=1 Tax=unclassified Brenneria TaxID=2634434 RepID=UPI0029C3F8BC|nr:MULTISPECIES: hypothetical protein [unclassified Brenneria]MDX5631000.1 hypothetical protein [Brenneria sp. L3-3Z]MDX5698081.1 hypothetical protein [Brenneria sp. L4-2C]MEE3664913.1 hypothetical protein [Brenneria sp. g21c3]